MMETTVEPLETKNDSQVELPPKQKPALAHLSIADGLYFLVFIAAAFIRFTSLGSIPLSPAEASQAFAVWQFMQPDQSIILVESPAYFSLTSILIAFFGSSDVVMRLIPALFGLGLVVLPWLLRDRLGQIGALAAAALFAVSPLFAVSSRTVGGDAIALFALLLAATALLKLDNGRDQKWLYVLAIAIGLGLASAPLIYGGLVTLGISRWVQRKISPEQSAGIMPDRSSVIKMIAVGLVVLIALSTRFLTYPSGIGSSAQIFGTWLSQFNWQGDLQSLIDPFLAIARYEVVLLPLGIFTIFWAIWRNHPFGTLLTYWLMAVLILILLQRGILANALLVPLAGYLLFGLATNQLLRSGKTRWTWAVTGIVLFLGAIILVNVTRFLRVSPIEGQQLLNLWMVFVALMAAALAIYFFWTIHDEAIIQGAWLGVLILLLLYQWGTAWHLTQKSANDPRERWVRQAADDELPVLLNTVEKISQRATNSDFDLKIFSAVDSPVLNWYLRDYWQAQFGQTLPPGAQYEVIISRVDAGEPSFGSDYLGTDFGLLRTGTDSTQLSSSPITDAMRWWFFHESITPFNEERIILWVRTDLVSSD